MRSGRCQSDCALEEGGDCYAKWPLPKRCYAKWPMPKRCYAKWPTPKQLYARRNWRLLFKAAATKLELPEGGYLWTDREEAWAAKCGQVQRCKAARIRLVYIRVAKLPPLIVYRLPGCDMPLLCCQPLRPEPTHYRILQARMLLKSGCVWGNRKANAAKFKRVT